MSLPAQPNVKLINAPDYREAYANSVQMRVNVWDFFMVFGTLQQQTETQVEIRNFQGIYLSPQQAKALLGTAAAECRRLRERLRRDQTRPAPDSDRAGALGTSTAQSARREILRDYRSDRSSPAQWSGAYPALVFAVIFVFIFLLHAPLLRLPYFWDEAGYYVPAARDLLLTGSLIPHIHGFERAPAAGDGVAGSLVEGGGLRSSGDADGDAGARGLLASGCVSAGRTRRQYKGCDRVHALHGAVSRLLRAKLSRAGGSGRGGAYLLGAVGLCGRRNRRNGVLVRPGCIDEGNCDSSSRSPCRMGDSRSACCVRVRCAELWLERRATSNRKRASVQRIVSLLISAYCRLRFGMPITTRAPDTSSAIQSSFATTWLRLSALTRFLLALAMRLWQISGYLHLWVLTLAMLLAMWMLPPRRDSVWRTSAD